MNSPWTDWIDHSVNRLTPVSRLASAPMLSQAPSIHQVISAEQAVTIAKNTIPGGHPVALSFPEDEKGVYSISLKTIAVWDSEVRIDQYSGKVLQLYTPSNATVGDHILGWLFPLHTGQAFGLPGRIFILALGLVPTVLYVTGLIRWLQKRRAKSMKSRHSVG